MSENDKKVVAIPFVAAVIGGVVIVLLSALLGFYVASVQGVKWEGSADVSARPWSQFIDAVSDK